MRKRQALNVQIEKHQDGAQKYLPPQVVDHIPNPDSNVLDDAWVDDDDADVDEEGLVANDLAQLTISVSNHMLPEKKPLSLPSSIGYRACNELGLQTLAKNELAL